MSQDVLSELVALSNRIGDPANDFVILGEGNTSAKADAETYYVKASGYELRTITAGGLVKCRFDTVLGLLAADDISDEAVKTTFAASVADGSTNRPSVEALLHALLLSTLEDVNFVAHTHPTAVNILTCAKQGEAAFAGRLFPDEMVCCGVAPIWIAFTDPGVPLARKVHSELQAYVAKYGARPKCILIQNHGLIALGATVAEVENATHMMCKTARIVAGTYLLGGPNFLTEDQVERIWNRPDEHYRIKLLEKR
jgi:rhamnose utilization protein RhaD (predicted bifunctional aldolase and dehydrogenase)